MCTYNYTDHIFTTIQCKECGNSGMKDTSITLQREEKRTTYTDETLYAKKTTHDF